MKIRILDDAIRLRLDREEVDLIVRELPVVARTKFPGGSTFGYELHVGGQELAAEFVDGIVRVTVPVERASQWARHDSEVSISGAASALQVLIEKDFECLEPRPGESQSNRFANPKAQR